MDRWSRTAGHPLTAALAGVLWAGIAFDGGPAALLIAIPMLGYAVVVAVARLRAPQEFKPGGVVTRPKP